MKYSARATSKYHAKKTTYQGQTFDSKKEATRYQELRLLQLAGEITDLQRQVPFLLIPAQYDNVPTLGSLFDGQGGFPLCWEEINGKGTARWASEIEKDAVAVTRYHFEEET